MEKEDLDFDDSNKILQLIVEKGELPQFIYKYTTIETAYSILKSSKLMFSKPSDFNDPFDCNITIDTNNTESEINEYIAHLERTQNVTKQQIESLKIKCHDPKILHQITNKSVKDVKETFGISCFSKNNNNLVMWAHYADKHRGLCLKFDILKDPEFFMIPIIVIYQKDYPVYNYIRQRSHLAKILSETKSMDWEYEQEIRILKHGPGLYQFIKDALVDINFGSRVKKEEQENIIKTASDNQFVNIDFSIGHISDSKFEVNFKKINNTTA